MKYTKVSCKKRYGGGGGNNSSTVSSIPDWARPNIQAATEESRRLYDSGQLSQVAGTSDLQNKAFGGAADAMNDSAMSGSRDLSNIAIDSSRPMITSAEQQSGNLQRIAGDSAEYLRQTGVEDRNAITQQRAQLVDDTRSGGYDTTELKNKAILEAGMRTAALGNQYGASGTLGSARQAVQQGSQNAMTAAAFADADRQAAQQMFTNRMGAQSALGSNINSGAQISLNGANAFNSILGGAATGANTMVSNAAKDNFGMRSSAITGGNTMLTNNASSLANLGNQQRTIEQQKLDAPWQGSQRNASTQFGQTDRQTTTQSGGK